MNDIQSITSTNRGGYFMPIIGAVKKFRIIIGIKEGIGENKIENVVSFEYVGCNRQPIPATY